MAVNSKQKGARGERELASKLKEYGFDTRRTVQYNGKAEEGQADLLGLPNIHIECKRVEKLNIYNAISQVKRDKKENEIGVVFHRKNESEWLVSMTLSEFMEIYTNSDYSEIKGVNDDI